MNPPSSATPAQTELEGLARHFEEAADGFMRCPLYQELCLTVAVDERLLQIAAERRPGQQPAYLLFAAVHYLLLADPKDELARWYVSIDRAEARSPQTAGPAFTAFCLARRDALVHLLREKLVQTNIVKRAVAMRLGLAEIAKRTDEPVTLVEIGASAGVLLAFDRYRYEMAGRSWGDLNSPVEISTEWRGSGDSPPDLDHLPTIASRIGIDLSPIDPRDPLGRRWLRALVWPGNEGQWTLLERALDLILDNPPRIISGDAIEVLSSPGALDFARGRAVVVFHAATRAHVPHDRRAALDETIRGLGQDRRVFWLSLEGPAEPLGRLAAGDHLLQLIEVDGDRQETQQLAVFDSHAEWAAPPA